MIPRVAHFIWLGARLPWVFVLAVRTARLHGGFAQVIFHHVDELDAPSRDRAVRARVDDCFQRLVPDELFASLGALGLPLRELYARLSQPAARANVLRLCILARQGGVYLDTDVLTVRSFAPLLQSRFFCGEEHLVLPARLGRSRNPARWLAAGVLLLARDLCRRLPFGHRVFARLASLYPRAANNAVMGAAPGHPFVLGTLQAMVKLPVEKQTVRFALGTHLLEDRVASALRSEVVVHPPAVFYPLAPEISEHWFRLRSSVRLDEALGPDTVAVHWYASVRTRHLLDGIDDDYVRAHAHDQLFSALATSLLVTDGEDLPLAAVAS
jgi:hypothetical protein